MGVLPELLLLLCLAASAIALAAFWWSRRRLRQLAALLPGPKPQRFHLLIGDAERFVQSSNDTFNVLTRLVDEFGPTCRMWIGPKLCVLLVAPRDAEVILSSTGLQTRDQFLMKVVRPLAGDGLISSEGSIWRIHRKVMLPTFHSKVLEQFVDVFNRHAEVLVGQLALKANGASVDIIQSIGLCTMDMICETAMGKTVDAQVKKDNKFVSIFKRGIHIIEDRVAKPWLLVDWVFNLTNLGREQSRIVTSVNRAIQGVISNKINLYRDKRAINNKQEHREITKSGMNSLDLLIETHGSESDIVNETFMRDEINTLLIAGQESTATLMSFALMLLGLYEDVQARVVKELEEIFKGDLRQPTTSQSLHQMKYLDRTIKETLRLYPPAPMITREISEEMNVGGHTLPAGCTAIIINYKTHRIEEWFPEPEVFDPDRFLPERSLGRHPFAFLPFGGGHKSCIGQKYSMIQMKTVLSMILRHYKVFTPCSRKDLDTLEMGMVLRPKCGFLIQLLPRECVTRSFC